MPFRMGHQAEDPARSGRRRPPRPRASRWGWPGSPGSAAPRCRRSGGRPGRPLRVAARAPSSASRNRPSPWATGSSIGSAPVTNGERPGVGARRTQRASKWPESLCVSVAAARQVGRPAGQQAGLDQNLKAVADAQDQAAPLVEPAQGIAQDRAEPGGEDPPGAEVVAIGEAAGDGQDREPVECAAAPRAAGRRARSRPSAPARCQAAEVSSSQLVPGARRTIARGCAMSALRALSIRGIVG